jgi:hypothetical protein
MADIRERVRSLFAALHTSPVNYLLVGGVALLSYVEGRNTQDIDLIIEPETVKTLDWNARIQDRNFGAANYQGLQVDLLLTSNPLFAHVWQHERTTITFDDLPIPCATREGLILLKLYALPSLYRQGNLTRAALYETDIRLLLQENSVSSDGLLAMLAPYVAAHDLDELRNIVGELQARRRFR